MSLEGAIVQGPVFRIANVNFEQVPFSNLGTWNSVDFQTYLEGILKFIFENVKIGTFIFLVFEEMPL